MNAWCSGISISDFHPFTRVILAYPMAHSLLLLVLGLVVQCIAQNSYYFENHKYCDDLSPAYGDITLDQISGIWYGVEKIPHTKGEYKIEHTTQECFYIDIKERYIQNLHPTHDFDEEAILGMWYIREYIYHKEKVTMTEYNPYCPIVQIRKFEDYVHGGLISRNLPTPPTPYPQLTNSPYISRTYGLPEQYRIRHFVLEWHEGLWQDDYHIKVNTSHKGFWPTDVPNGSVENMYRFFGGVIQVLKVANNHLVLNFCMRLPHSQLFSVVLARNENQLTSEDLASIHNVFTMKHLSTSALKRVCENSAASNSLSSFLIFIIVYSFFRSRA